MHRPIILPTRQWLSRGFTLVEAMVVLAIVAILAMIAVPSFQATLDRQQVTTVAADLHASVVLARAEAIRRNLRIELMPIDPLDWAKGWQVVVPPQGAVPSQVIYSRPAAPAGVVVMQNLVPAGEASLSYDGTGKSRLASNAAIQRSGNWLISIPARPSAPSRKLAINILGRPLLCDPAQPPC
jgi:prepilin-type N-terminal cleavage/methylation domain-containing protein